MSSFKHSEETREKMRLAWKNRKLTPFSDETRAKMSEARKAEKNPVWNGGAIKYRIDQAKKRDNFTCQRCGFRDDEIMVVDHINPRFIRPDLTLITGNLMTLCPNCHARKTKEDRKVIAGYKRNRDLIRITRYQNSVCARGNFLHKWIEIKRTDIGVVERCERCGLKKHFPNTMPNHLYLSYHIRSVLRGSDSMFKREYPNIEI